MNKKILSKILIVSMVLKVIMPNLTLYAIGKNSIPNIAEQQKNDLVEDKTNELFGSNEYNEQYSYTIDNTTDEGNDLDKELNDDSIDFDLDNCANIYNLNVSDIITTENTEDNDYIESNAEDTLYEHHTELNSESLSESSKELEEIDVTTQISATENINNTQITDTEIRTESSEEITKTNLNTSTVSTIEIIEEVIDDISTNSIIVKDVSCEHMNENNIIGTPDVKIY